MCKAPLSKVGYLVAHVNLAGAGALLCKIILPPRSPTRVIWRRTALCAELLLPNCVHFSCCSLRNCIDPLQLLLPVCIHFSCCSLLASASAAALDCIHFNCSPIASASAATPQLSASTAAPQLHLLQLLLPDCVRFNCCSLIASASTAAPRQLFWKIPAHARCS